MGGFQNKVMWREWRQVFFSCLCSDLCAHAKINGVVWGVFFCCFCSGSRAQAKINGVVWGVFFCCFCSDLRAHAKINCW